MTTAIKRRRGTTTQHSTFTGLEGEITIDTTKDTAVVHDGATAGGRPLLREDLANNTEIVTKTGTQTLTNKTLTSPVINTPTGITKSDISLGNVDNTSDATKNAATATLTNKTITLGANTISGTVAQFQAAVTDGDFATLAGTETFTNKALNGTLGATTPSTIAATTISASGVSTFSAGTAGAPALTTTGDTNTGMFFPAADTIAFSEGGVESMRINSSGRLGIGTTSPRSLLDITSTTTDALINLDGGSAASSFLNFRIAGTNKGYIGLGAYTGGSNDNLAYWTSGAGSHLFYTNSALKMTLDASGNLGLGVTPSAWIAGYKAQQIGGSLTLASSTGIGFEFITSNGYIGTGDLYKYIGTGPAVAYRLNNNAGIHAWYNAPSGTAGNNITFTQAMTLDASGNLGIGTATPAISGSAFTILNVKGVSNTTALITATSGDLASSVQLYSGASTSDNPAIGYQKSLRFGSTTDSGIGGFTERMRVESAGNVGIGTTSVPQKLTILNANGTYGVAYQPAFQIGNSSSGGSVGSNTGLGAIVWSTDGVITPVASIEAVRENPGGGAASCLVFRTGASGGGTERARIESSGNLLVGTTAGLNAGKVVSYSPSSFTGYGFRSDSATAAGTGWGHFYGTSSNNTAANILIYGNGNIANANGSYAAFSDIKLKENIVNATPKLEKLNKVRVVNYNLKTDPNQKLLGVVAQELEPIFPALIEETEDRKTVTKTREVEVPAVEEVLDDEGNVITAAVEATTRTEEYTEDVLTGETTKSVKYSVFVPILIKAMQEQQAMIEELKAKVAALEAA